MTETHVVALSGGKDSTALALRLRELYPDRDFIWFCTPTGDELPAMIAHWEYLEGVLGPITRVTNRTLDDWIEDFDALPNWRQRWCTRLLKIEPCLAYLAKLPNPVLYVGLRADEEERKGIYSENVRTVFPLREWGWSLQEVRGYLAEKGVKIPKRTDCARCYGQRLSEWYELWRDHRDLYEDAERQEAKVGNTFRSPGRDSWPASLEGLRAEFESGRKPRGVNDQVDMFDDGAACRVCRI
jgi:3'-phosphoadenosine 5'-phosphosulfate sulfotransferase (PAPS reductase)/FAD synthetase